MHCFNCRQEMQKKAYNGVLIDHCSTCRSIWLDPGELDKLAADDTTGAATLRQQAKAELLAEASRPLTILSACPKCQIGQMREQVIDGVKLDYCTSCKGLYFDHGELQEAIANKQTSILKRWQRRLFGS